MSEREKRKSLMTIFILDKDDNWRITARKPRLERRGARPLSRMFWRSRERASEEHVFRFQRGGAQGKEKDDNELRSFPSWCYNAAP